jgi:hypothetical protein
MTRRPRVCHLLIPDTARRLEAAPVQPVCRWSRRRRPGRTQNLGNGLSLRGRLTHAPQDNGYGLCCELPPRHRKQTAHNGDNFPAPWCKKRLPWLPKKSSYPLDAGQNPYYCESKIQTSEPSCHDGSARHCTGALCPCIAANHQGNISACQPDDLGAANSKVTSK